MQGIANRGKSCRDVPAASAVDDGASIVMVKLDAPTSNLTSLIESGSTGGLSLSTGREGGMNAVRTLSIWSRRSSTQALEKAP